MRFVQFFVGTPQRLLATIIILIVVWGIFNLDSIEQFLNQLLAIAINQVLPLAIVIGLIAYAFRKLLGK